MSRLHRADWILSGLLSVQLVTLFVAVPLSGHYPPARLLLDGCRLLYALVCVAALTQHRLLQAWLLAAMALLMGWSAAGGWLLGLLGGGGSSALQHELIEGNAFAFNLAVTVLIARKVFGPGRVTAHRVQGAVLLYLNIAALFAIAYNGLLGHWPGAIMPSAGGAITGSPIERGAALTYFSFSTLTTTGYGDLVPVHPLARSLANLEAVIGQLFPATLLARIVALHLEHSRHQMED